MIKIPYETIIGKIKEKAGISDVEIEEKISAKLKQLSGLISREGAAHIVANELGVKVFEPLSGKLQIKNILSGMRDVETIGKVLDVYDIREFNREGGSGKVGSLMIADETDSIKIVMWGAQADILRSVKKGDILKVMGGYVRDNNGRREVHVNDRTRVLINPKGESVDNAIEAKSQRKIIKDLSESDNDVELLGTVVQVFEPRFFEVCSQCGRKVKMEEQGYVCNRHNSTTAADAYVVNAVLDDGTETIRTVFFRNNAAKLFNLSHEEFLRFKSNPEEFAKAKETLPGSIIKVSGKSNKNAMFDRLEFIANSVDINPSPEEELQRLEKQKYADLHK